MKPILIVAAISSRAYVQAAVAAGYDVIALDAFADADLTAFAKQTVKLKFDDNDLDETYFKHVFLQLNLSNIHGFLYGSLFDNCPHLLAWVAELVPVIGNSAEVLNQAKAFSFFALLDNLNIAHPDVSLDLPTVDDNWLTKQIGGSGGMQIKPAKLAQADESFQKSKILNIYFQKVQAGTPISMLFVADGCTAKTIGFNQQFIAPTTESPYRFAGAVSNIALPSSIQAVFEHAARALTQTLHLRGINSLDAILYEEKLWILELNPRLSATFQLYEQLLPVHIQSCAGAIEAYAQKIDSANAMFILYSDENITLTKDFTWPSWVADIPLSESNKSSVKICKNRPICSVLASAKTADLAHALVLQRVEKLTEMLINNDKQ